MKKITLLTLFVLLFCCFQAKAQEKIINGEIYYPFVIYKHTVQPNDTVYTKKDFNEIDYIQTWREGLLGTIYCLVKLYGKYYIRKFISWRDGENFKIDIENYDLELEIRGGKFIFRELGNHKFFYLIQDEYLYIINDHDNSTKSYAKEYQL